MAALDPSAVLARTSLIMGGPSAPMERRVLTLLSGRADGVLFDDDVRCPVHVEDLAAALLELAQSDAAGVRHVAGADAVSRYEIGLLLDDAAAIFHNPDLSRALLSDAAQQLPENDAL